MTVVFSWEMMYNTENGQHGIRKILMDRVLLCGS